MERRETDFLSGFAAIASEYELDRGLQGLHLPTFIEVALNSGSYSNGL